MSKVWYDVIITWLARHQQLMITPSRKTNIIAFKLLHFLQLVLSMMDVNAEQSVLSLVVYLFVPLMCVM